MDDMMRFCFMIWYLKWTWVCLGKYLEQMWVPCGMTCVTVKQESFSVWLFTSQYWLNVHLCIIQNVVIFSILMWYVALYSSRSVKCHSINIDLKLLWQIGGVRIIFHYFLSLYCRIFDIGSSLDSSYMLQCMCIALQILGKMDLFTH